MPFFRLKTPAFSKNYLENSHWRNEVFARAISPRRDEKGGRACRILTLDRPHFWEHLHLLFSVENLCQVHRRKRERERLKKAAQKVEKNCFFELLSLIPTAGAPYICVSASKRTFLSEEQPFFPFCDFFTKNRYSFYRK